MSIRKIFHIFSIVVFLSLVTLSSPTRPVQADDPTGTISGTVRNAGGTALENIVVTVIWPEGQLSVCTPANGEYLVSSIPLGSNYRVFATSTTDPWCANTTVYGKQFWPNTYTYGLATTITLDELNPNATGKDFSLGPGGSISGTITDGNHTGLNKIDVTIDGPDDGIGTCTDTSGNFQFDNVPLDIPWRVYAASIEGNGCTGGKNTYAQQFYNHVIYDHNATQITLTGGSPNRSSVNFELVPGGIIRGKVTLASNHQGVENVRLGLINGSGWIYDACTDADGNYEFDQVPYGYTFEVTTPSQYCDRSPSPYGAQTYPNVFRFPTLDTSPVTGINFEIGPPPGDFPRFEVTLGSNYIHLRDYIPGKTVKIYVYDTQGTLVYGPQTETMDAGEENGSTSWMNSTAIYPGYTLVARDADTDTLLNSYIVPDLKITKADYTLNKFEGTAPPKHRLAFWGNVDEYWHSFTTFEGYSDNSGIWKAPLPNGFVMDSSKTENMSFFDPWGDETYVQTRPADVVTPSGGGDVILPAPDSGVLTTANIPPNAVSENVTLVISPGTTAGDPNFKIGDRGFSMKTAAGTGYNFNQPVEVRLEYTDAEVAGMDENALNLMYFNTATGQWVPAANSCYPSSVLRNTVENWIIVKVCHFSEYAFVGREDNLPRYLYPPDNTTLRPGRTSIILRWYLPINTKANQISKYRVQLGLDEGFSKVILDKKTSATSLDVGGLLPDTTYYWRVQALFKNGKVGNWSSLAGPRRLITSKTNPPVLLLPARNSLQTKTKVSFAWSVPPGLPGRDYRFVLQTSSTIDFKPGTYTEVPGLVFPYTSQALPHYNPEQTVYWRVKVVSLEGKNYSDFQAPHSFVRK